MPATPLSTIPEFRERNRLSHSTYHNLKLIGRAPIETIIGGRRFISDPAEAAWRQSLIDDPIIGGIRPLAEKIQREKSSPTQNDAARWAISEKAKVAPTAQKTLDE